MNTTIDLKTAKTIDIMSQQISHMDNAVTDFFNKMSDVLERQLGDDEVYAAVIAPEVELTITPLANVRSYLLSPSTQKAIYIALSRYRKGCSPPRQNLLLSSWSQNWMMHFNRLCSAGISVMNGIPVSAYPITKRRKSV